MLTASALILYSVIHNCYLIILLYQSITILFISIYYSYTILPGANGGDGFTAILVFTLLSNVSFHPMFYYRIFSF